MLNYYKVLKTSQDTAKQSKSALICPNLLSMRKIYSLFSLCTTIAFCYAIYTAHKQNTYDCSFCKTICK